MQNTDKDTESKRQIEYDMMYLAAYGINSKPEGKQSTDKRGRDRKSTDEKGTDRKGNVTADKPDERCLERYRTSEDAMKELYTLSAKHFIDALVGTTLKQAGVQLPKYWEEHIIKAIRKLILFDTERKKLCDWMDSEQIWYLPLKGIVLKEYYPSAGLRQMSDNDILFDADAWDRLEAHMIAEGYEAESVGKGNHDVYQKPPVYNFEMHRSLYGRGHEERWVEYYSDIKERLIPDNTRCGFHMKEEDFYVYITSHAFKHYSGNGTGMRTLLDFYAYLRVKEEALDFSYIEEECRKLGIETFEKQNRRLCYKVFSPQQKYDRIAFEQSLAPSELNMLKYYLSSGVYGTFDRMVSNRMKKYTVSEGKLSKLVYYWHRIFPGMELYENYPLLIKHRWLIPAYWFFRIVRMIFSSRRRENMMREVKAVKRIAICKTEEN